MLRTVVRMVVAGQVDVSDVSFADIFADGDCGDCAFLFAEHFGFGF